MDVGRMTGAFSLWFAHAWWTGFKVFCRWCAFCIVLSVLWLPVLGLAYLVKGYTQSLGLPLVLAIAPIPFYLTSRYLLLLGDSDQASCQAAEGRSDVGQRDTYSLRTKIIISTVAAYLSGFLFLAPPDLIPALTVGAMAAFFCGVPLAILARFMFFKAASHSGQILICVVVYLAAMGAIAALLLGMRAAGT